MKRDFFIPTYPSPKINIEQSLGANLLSNIQLTDYFLNSSAHSSEWLRDFSNLLPKNIKEDLQVLRTVFAHGVILREYYIKNHDNLDEGWEQFISWWKEMSEAQVLDLLIYGIRETMDYYYQFLPRNPLVEKTMEHVNLEEEELKEPVNRSRAIKAVLESWSVGNVEEIQTSYGDLASIKERMIRLIEGFWNYGFKELWEKENKWLAEWQQKNNQHLSKLYRTNEEALLEVTGLFPDTNELDNLRRAETMTFLPVINLDRLLIFFNVDQHIYVMFDPLGDTAEKQTNAPDFTAISPAFEGMGDQTRLQIIGLLAENREMFAQQIVTKLDMKQSTISRHLNQLNKSGLVSIRRVGNTKYFSINNEEIKKMMDVLETFLK
ncbi:helix-turn-helix transcriptional regulator [Virgibacillus sp. NKC19-16]|uniref:ArsR/SmtB family transcription factor n=1 Tax=Virgibacillus salidurans TaxID=2831673 RepID=UPI001F3BAF86|nr:metalloregulator ArsR/SmtB family transcription factor [Virgibacillus sp. NKC19-16]UJL45270.1 helix-turn-helix transcriptional regulator [Virgibacillus sp. NKC19-16]